MMVLVVMEYVNGDDDDIGDGGDENGKDKQIT